MVDVTVIGCDVGRDAKELEIGVMGGDSRSLSFEEKIFQVYEYKGGTTRIHPLLSSLVNYAEPVKFQGFDIAEGKTIKSNQTSWHRGSFLKRMNRPRPSPFRCSCIDHSTLSNRIQYQQSANQFTRWISANRINASTIGALFAWHFIIISLSSECYT